MQGILFSSHIVCGQNVDKGKIAETSDVYVAPIVTERWVTDCCIRTKLQPTKPYNPLVNGSKSLAAQSEIFGSEKFNSWVNAVKFAMKNPTLQQPTRPVDVSEELPAAPAVFDDKKMERTANVVDFPHSYEWADVMDFFTDLKYNVASIVMCPNNKQQWYCSRDFLHCRGVSTICPTRWLWT